MSQILSVNAIQQGTVIDHIPAGQALKIMRLLSMVNSQHQVTLGLNLMSQRLGLKDLIKIKDRQLNSNEIDLIALFASQATFNRIQDFGVHEKYPLTLPTEFKEYLLCPNPNCIVTTENLKGHFSVTSIAKRVQLRCYYCEQQFDRDALRSTL